MLKVFTSQSNKFTDKESPFSDRESPFSSKENAFSSKSNKFLEYTSNVKILLTEAGEYLMTEGGIILLYGDRE